MPSLLENYKDTNDLSYESDLNATSQLYKSSKNYQEKYSFEDFVKYAVENSSTKLDGSMSSYINPNKYTSKGQRKNFGNLLSTDVSLQDYTDSSRKAIDKVKNLSKEEIQELMPFKNTRRTFGGLLDKLSTGTIALAGDVMAPVNPLEQIEGNKFRIKTEEDILSEEAVKLKK